MHKETYPSRVVDGAPALLSGAGASAFATLHKTHIWISISASLHAPTDKTNPLHHELSVTHRQRRMQCPTKWIYPSGSSADMP